MCRWYCTSKGVLTNLQCLHCRVWYCNVCLHGDAGRMVSPLKCANCGQKPRTMDRLSRSDWMSPSPINTRVKQRRARSANKATRARRAKKKLSKKDMQLELARIFDYYCNFSPATAEMTSFKWAKCLREMGLLGLKFIKPADIDLAFTRAKRVGERRLDFECFVEAMAEIAARRYYRAKSVTEALRKLVSNYIVHANGPWQPEVQEQKRQMLENRPQPRVIQYLTDHTQYTGTHRYRFDEQGRGLGLAGRDSVKKGKGTIISMRPTHNSGSYGQFLVNDLSQITRTPFTYVTRDQREVTQRDLRTHIKAFKKKPPPMLEEKREMRLLKYTADPEDLSRPPIESAEPIPERILTGPTGPGGGEVSEDYQPDFDMKWLSPAVVQTKRGGKRAKRRPQSAHVKKSTGQIAPQRAPARQNTGGVYTGDVYGSNDGGVPAHHPLLDQHDSAEDVGVYNGGAQQFYQTPSVPQPQGNRVETGYPSQVQPQYDYTQYSAPQKRSLHHTAPPAGALNNADASHSQLAHTQVPQVPQVPQVRPAAHPQMAEVPPQMPEISPGGGDELPAVSGAAYDITADI